MKEFAPSDIERKSPFTKDVRVAVEECLPDRNVLRDARCFLLGNPPAPPTAGGGKVSAQDP